MRATNKIVRMENLQQSRASQSAPWSSRKAAEAIVFIRDKWTILVLGALVHDPSLRYKELQRNLVGISQHYSRLR